MNGSFAEGGERIVEEHSLIFAEVALVEFIVCVLSVHDSMIGEAVEVFVRVVFEAA